MIEVTSDKNYMKRLLEGSLSMAAPFLSVGGLYYTSTSVIPHNLGYRPFFVVQYELGQDGIIWQPGGVRAFGATNPLVDPDNVTAPALTVYPDDNNLTIELSYFDNSLTGLFNVHYVIYQDYGLI